MSLQIKIVFVLLLPILLGLPGIGQNYLSLEKPQQFKRIKYNVGDGVYFGASDVRKDGHAGGY